MTKHGAVRVMELADVLEVVELLAEALGRPVDLVTPAAVEPWMRERVEREAVRAA